MVTRFTNRIRIDGALVLKTELTLGNGKSVSGKGDYPHLGVNAEFIAAVARDHNEYPMIPGASLKGVLRSFLVASTSEFDSTRSKRIERLFGSAPTNDEDDADCEGGIVEVHSAHCTNRTTSVVTSVGIDRITRTASDRKLFSQEYVPSGTTFLVQITAQNLSEDDLALILESLAAFNLADDPVRLGRDGRNHTGRAVWRLDSVQQLEHTNVSQWFADHPNAVGYDQFPTRPDVERLGSQAEVHAKTSAATRGCRLSFDVVITFTGPFLVNDPTRCKPKGASRQAGQEYNHTPRTVQDASGTYVLLPARSARGAIQAQAYRIAKTLGLPATDPHDTKRAGQKHPDPSDFDKLFGRTDRASALEVENFKGTAPLEFPLLVKQFVAIDRFTGGSADGKLYDAQYVDRPTLKGRLHIDLARVSPASLGLLALVLRDLQEGDVAFGFGAAKGFGICRATLESPVLRGLVALQRNSAWSKSLPHDPDWANKPDGLAAFLDNCIAAYRHELKQPIQPKPTAFRGTPKMSLAPPPYQVGESDATFYNPYHFIPSGVAQAGISILEFKKFLAGSGNHRHLGHDQYLAGQPGHAEDFFSGRIVCRLTAVQPLVVGNEQTRHDNAATEIRPFEMDDQPAIPASTLRGLISSLAEAASDSAMRVLANTRLSVRSNINNAKHRRPAIGMVIEKNGKRFVRPLTFPVLVGEERNGAFVARIDVPYQPLADKLVLPVYLDGYDGSQATATRQRRGFLGAANPPSYTADFSQPDLLNRDQFWRVPLHANAIKVINQTSIQCTLAEGKIKGGRFLIGQRPLTNEAPTRLGAEQIEPNTDRGILRILGNEQIGGDPRSLPPGKVHELFIPVPDLDYFVNGVITKSGFDHDLLADDAIKLFEDLALQRTKADPANLPFELAGQPRRGDPVTHNNREAGHAVNLAHGDLVYFRLKADKTEIDSVSISSVWREDAGTVHEYFKPDQLPFANDRQGKPRTRLTPAELLFGFVSEEKKDRQQQSDEIQGLASRVRFGFGRYAPAESPQSSPYLNEITLRILASPKPPCPAMYFFRKDGRPPVKDQVAAPTNDRAQMIPQGRKFYLHHPIGNAASWETGAGDGDNQKVRVTPVRPGVKFVFHVDFENLTRAELELLCFSLRPFPEFHHKLGLGKPLGLGSVKIEPVGIFYINRYQRYAVDGDGAGRYAGKACTAAAMVQKLGLDYAAEQTAPVDAGPTFDELASAFAPAPEIAAAIRVMGTVPTFQQDAPGIHYPVVHNATSTEGDHFKWFVAYDKMSDPARAAQSPQMKPIKEAKGPPTMNRLKEQ